MDIFIETEIKEGESFKLRKGTSSIRPGETITITGFLDDNKDHILCDGLLPGGFIDRKNIDIKPKLKPGLRLKSLLELLEIYGPHLSNVIPMGMSSFSILNLGGPVSWGNISHNDINNIKIRGRLEYMTIDGGFTISEEWVTTDLPDIRKVHNYVISGADISPEMLNVMDPITRKEIENSFIGKPIANLLPSHMSVMLDGSLRVLNNNVHYIIPYSYMNIKAVLTTGETILISPKKEYFQELPLPGIIAIKDQSDPHPKKRRPSAAI